MIPTPISFVSSALLKSLPKAVQDNPSTFDQPALVLDPKSMKPVVVVVSYTTFLDWQAASTGRDLRARIEASDPE